MTPPSAREEWRAFAMAAGVVALVTAAAWCSLGGCAFVRSHATVQDGHPAFVTPLDNVPAKHSDGGAEP